MVIWLEWPSVTPIRGGVHSLRASIFNGCSLLMTSEQHLEWNNNWARKFIVWEFSCLFGYPEHLPVPLTGFTKEFRCHFSLRCSESRIPEDFTVCCYSNTMHQCTEWTYCPIQLRITIISSSPTNLIRPFYFHGKHRCSPLHQFQKLVHSWVSAELQLFNTCVQSKTMSPIRCSAHCRITSEHDILVNVKKNNSLNYSKPHSGFFFFYFIYRRFFYKGEFYSCSPGFVLAPQTVDKFGLSYIHAWQWGKLHQL